MDSFATAVSLALQYGVPLQVLCDKFSHTRFEPSGWSGYPKIGYANSLTDYLFRWLELRFLKGEQGLLFELPKLAQPQREVTSAIEGLEQVVELGDAPPCQFCGSLMVRNGSCYRCMTCGSTSGCSWGLAMFPATGRTGQIIGLDVVLATNVGDREIERPG
jgi:ribonucleoside-diphosphate reductase alpha chain